jgi:hypothetical protein
MRIGVCSSVAVAPCGALEEGRVPIPRLSEPGTAPQPLPSAAAPPYRGSHHCQPPRRTSEGSMKVSSLGYGLGSWGLLNVLFVLSMLYAGRRTAATGPHQHLRTTRRRTFDRDVRIAQGARADRRRPGTTCDWPARSRHAPPRRSRTCRTGRYRGVARVRRSLELRPVSRREPRLRSPGRRWTSCAARAGPR